MKLTIKNRFATTPNELLNNPKISLRAKGLYGYIQSKPDGWDFSASRIAVDCKECTNVVYDVISELEDFGFLKRVFTLTQKGRSVEYILYVDSSEDNSATPILANLPSATLPSATLPEWEYNKERIKEKKIIRKKESSTPLENSNLYRKPNIPSKESVIEYFIRTGGNEIMANKFFDKYQATGWYLNNSPITTWNILANNFINNWKKNENGNTKDVQQIFDRKITRRSIS